MAGHRFIADVVKSLADAGGRKKRGRTPVSAATAAGAPIGEARGSGFGGSASGSGGGIASPLTEPDATQRQYHPSQDVYNQDGTIVKVHPVKQITMKDAAGATVVFNYALPDYASIAP